jgi:hypothetical protein
VAHAGRRRRRRQQRLYSVPATTSGGRLSAVAVVALTVATTVIVIPLAGRGLRGMEGLVAVGLIVHLSAHRLLTEIVMLWFYSLLPKILQKLI